MSAAVPRPEPRVAVGIPCLDEALTIAGVVAAFRAALPDAAIVVIDNNCTDGTAAIARAAGAAVLGERRPGKGNAVRRFFAEIDADVYLLVDGDGTYPAAAAPALVSRLLEGRLDMVAGARADVTRDAGRPSHAFGNRAFNRLFALLFGAGFVDIFTGYRVFSRRFVKSFPALSQGFAIETEIAVHCLALGLPTDEISIPYGRRPAGSASKLRTYADGSRILGAFVLLLKEAHPARFFGWMAGLLLLAALLVGLPVVVDFWRTGLVPRLPSAVLAAALTIIAALTAMCGLILDSVARGRAEAKRAVYVGVQASGT